MASREQRRLARQAKTVAEKAAKQKNGAGNYPQHSKPPQVKREDQEAINIQVPVKVPGYDPHSLDPGLAARMEKAREKAGYPPKSEHTAGLSALFAAANEETVDQTAVAQSEVSPEEMTRRMEVARRKAGYGVLEVYPPQHRIAIPKPPLPPPPVALMSDPEMIRRMEKARQAAGYSETVPPYKRAKPNPPVPSPSLPPTMSSDMAARMERARLASGYGAAGPNDHPPQQQVGVPAAHHAPEAQPVEEPTGMTAEDRILKARTFAGYGDHTPQYAAPVHAAPVHAAPVHAANHDEPVTAEMAARRQKAREAAGYVTMTMTSNQPPPPAPLPIPMMRPDEITPDVQARMERARKAAGYAM